MDGRARAGRGTAAEIAAEEHLERTGMRAVARDVRLKNGQIDLVMRDGETLVLVEVKARRGSGYGLPQDAVDGRKLARLRRLAETYQLLHPSLGADLRVDVVAVDLDGAGRPGRCQHIPDVLV
ncbi:MAG TPA: YraN family protein [Candidatus Dormibacteraeota bacterium]|nr:YraN family protein [Candidatus Dormibacteraeota bacterium]